MEVLWQNACSENGKGHVVLECAEINGVKIFGNKI